MRSMSLPMLALLFAGPLVQPTAAQDTTPAQAHLGHVAEAFGPTPEGRGLLPTAIAEARVAAQHAELAARDLENLEAMQLHAGHVLHAVDPSLIERGPGAGYGVKAAAEGVVNHLQMAMDDESASENLRTHGLHVVSSARTTVTRAERMAELAEQIRAAGSAAEAAPLVEQLHELSEQLLAGEDADGSGTVSWREGEGGLEQAETHLGLLLQGEGHHHHR